MKRPFASAHLSPHFHQPLRFGRAWRGHELILRLIQVALLLFVGVAGGRVLAHAVAVGGRALANLVS